MAALLASVAAATAHGLRMSVNLVIVKMIAVMIGPAGMGLLGQFMSLSTMVTVFAGGGIGNGITKYVAEYRHDSKRLLRFIGASAVYGLVFSAFVLLVCVAAARPIARSLFGDERYAWLLPCLALAQLLCFVGTAVIAIVNGQQRADLFARITIIGYLSALPIAYLLISYFGFEGAALALLLVVSCTGIPSLWLIARARLTRQVRLVIDAEDALRLGRYSLMLFASATLFPLTEILIRTRIMENLGQEAAGLWQAMARLSGAYLGFFTVFLATNYMPRLSALSDRATIVETVRRNFLFICLTFVCFASVIYLLRGWVIWLLFSDEFQGMAPLFGWQLLGDLFRLGSYVIGFLGVAKAAVRIYIVAEFTQASLYAVLSSIVLEQGGGLRQVFQAYALTYFVYLCIAAFALFIYGRDKH